MCRGNSLANYSVAIETHDRRGESGASNRRCDCEVGNARYVEFTGLAGASHLPHLIKSTLANPNVTLVMGQPWSSLRLGYTIRRVWKTYLPFSGIITGRHAHLPIDTDALIDLERTPRCSGRFRGNSHYPLP